MLDDPRGIAVSTDTLTVQEGGSSTITVALSSQPTGYSVVLRLEASGDPDVSVSPTSIYSLSSDWQLPKTVTVYGRDDPNTENDSATITIEGRSGGYEGVTRAVSVTVEDDETDTLASTAVTLSVDRPAVSEGVGESGQAVTVTGTLNGAERSEETVVTVSVTGGTAATPGDFAAVGDFDLTISTNTLSGAATFSLTPVDDDAIEGGETIEISGSTTSSLRIDSTRLTITDNDDEPPVGVDGLYFTSFPGPRRPYHAGEVVEAELKFGGSVRITGMPQLTMNVGGQDRTADYYSTTGRHMRLRYTVADGDMDTDGVSIDANSLSLNGGAIRDSIMYRPRRLGSCRRGGRRATPSGRRQARVPGRGAERHNSDPDL